MRTANRLLALALGLALLAGGAIAALEVLFGALGKPPMLIPKELWDRRLSELRWDDPGLTLLLVLLIAGGLFLALAQLVPHPPLLLEVPVGVGAKAVVRRRGLEARLTGLAERLPEVTSATTRVKRRSALVRVTLPRGVAPESVEERLRPRLHQELSAWGLDEGLLVKVSARLDGKTGRLR